MSDLRTMKGALKLLREARAWFTSEDRLPLDWDDTFENRIGNRLSGHKTACRACILGGLVVADNNRGSNEHFLAYGLIRGRRDIAWFCRRHPLGVVWALYDRAIAKLEKQIAAAERA
jgi:hypothetical protein